MSIGDIHCPHFDKHILISCICFSFLFLCSASEATSKFRSNNQEANVDEADFVQSDGKFLYAAYGDVLLAWDIKNGKIVANITMPAIEYTPYNAMYSMTGEVIPGGDNATNDTMNQNVSSDDAFNMYGDMYGYYYKPKAQIQSLLLADNRLAVVISGYGGSTLQYADPNFKPKVMSEYLATRLQIYDTLALATNGGKLKLLNETDINGSFRDGRVVGNNVHLVTVASFNTYTLLSDPLSKWQPTFMVCSSGHQACRGEAHSYIC
jgi:Beta propeller domain